MATCRLGSARLDEPIARDRETSSAAERARTAVMQRVRSAIKRIAERQPALADHLAGRVETGTYCVYRPDPTRPIDWDLG